MYEWKEESMSLTNIDDRYEIAPASNHSTSKQSSYNLGKFWPLITNLMVKYMSFFLYYM